MKSPINKLYLILSFLVLGILPVSVKASNPFEGAFEGIANFFNMDVFSDSDMQIGLIRFLLWIALFSILFWSGSQFVFKGDEGRKTAGIVAAIISLISVIFMPANAISAIGTAYSATIFVLLTVGIAGVATYFAFGVLKGEWWKELFGLLILILASMIMNVVLAIMMV